MNREIIDVLKKKFEDSAHKTDDIEFWFARDLQIILGYVEWRKFQGVIEKAIESYANSGYSTADHFVKAAKKVKLGSEAEREIDDVMLTRYACYLIAQNGDPRKEEIDNLARLMQKPDENFNELKHIWDTQKKFRLLKGGLL